MRSPFTVESLPNGHPVHENWTALRLRSSGPAVTCCLRRRGVGVSMSPARLAAVLADLLRPGWDERARVLAVPVIRDGVIYRGFRLERLSRVDGERWELIVVIPTQMGEAFDWQQMTRQLNRFHATVFDRAAHV